MQIKYYIFLNIASQKCESETSLAAASWRDHLCLVRKDRDRAAVFRLPHRARMEYSGPKTGETERKAVPPAAVARRSPAYSPSSVSLVISSATSRAAAPC